MDEYKQIAHVEGGHVKPCWEFFDIISFFSINISASSRQLESLNIFH